MSPCELVMLISAVSCAISEKVDKDELDLLAAAFTQLGDTLATISLSREQNCKDNS